MQESQLSSPHGAYDGFASLVGFCFTKIALKKDKQTNQAAMLASPSTKSSKRVKAVNTLHHPLLLFENDKLLLHLMNILLKSKQEKALTYQRADKQ